MKFGKTKNIVKEGLILTFGTAVYAVAVEVFLSPIKISPGGITGIAAALNFITDIPTGLYILIFNIPIIIIGIFKFGGKFMAKTAISVILSSLFIEIIANHIPPLFTDKILCSVFGGLLLGLGLGVIMLIGASTGGVDIAVKLVNAKYNVSIGRAFLFIDGFVILFATVVYGNIESALYSVVAIFLSSRMVDTIIYGRGDSKALFIITANAERVRNDLFDNFKRGVTLIDAKGGYTGNKCSMLVCVVRNNEINNMRKFIRKTDETAFFFIVNAGDVVGKGFE